MLQFSKFKVTIILGIILLGIIFSAPNLVPEDKLESLPGWLPKTVISLGLDLQGGSHLLYEVDTGKFLKERLDAVENDIRDKLTKGETKFGYLNLQASADTVSLTLRDPTQIDAARPLLQQATTDMDLQIGSDGKVVAKYTDQTLARLKAQLIEQSIEVIRKRIDETGTKEPTIIRQGEDRIVVQLPGVKEPERIKAIIDKTAKMTFHMVDEAAEVSGQPGPTDMVVKVRNPRDDGAAQLIVQKVPLLSGQNLTDAQQTFEGGGQPVVSFKFDSIGAKKFGQITSQNVGRRFAIILDGEIVTAPVIKDAILGGSGIISGSFTVQTAGDLALLLRAGALPADLTVIEERTVGADLGADSIAAGKKACLIAIVLIVVAMLVLYGFFGLIANVALVLNAVLILAGLSALGATLTFPGIAGLVLTLGMAVDANVLILERVREEMRHGRSPVTAMESGYREAQATIIDANVTHVIATLFLFWFGSGPIKGFAITLLIGVVTSFFTSVYVTRLMTSLWLRRARPKALPL
ncbi:protein translocase subunit SecD [Dongia sp.]|uniref:protein translocase subunit SecD n=1 Tax=Dongia sp. TaxID=1977262 RepID=UPI00374FFE39